MLRKFLYALPWLALGLLAVIFGLALYGPSQNVTFEGASVEGLRETYESVEKVHPSSLSPRLTELARKRADCFGASPMARFDGLCHSEYLRDILRVGREEIESAPRLGDFLVQVDSCPIVYSVCMGEKSAQDCRESEGERVCEYAEENMSNCAAMEARCIDRILDIYWRGSPVDSYGSERLL